MTMPAVKHLTERAEYVMAVPTHQFDEDFRAATDVASPRTLAHALALQSLWYNTTALYLQTLAAIAHEHALDIVLPGDRDDVDQVRIVGPAAVLDAYDFLERADKDSE